jgi:hypothetical protein
MCIGVVPQNMVYIYLSVVPAGMLINGTVPLFYEAAVEVRCAPVFLVHLS